MINDPSGAIFHTWPVKPCSFVLKKVVCMSSEFMLNEIIFSKLGSTQWTLGTVFFECFE